MYSRTRYSSPGHKHAGRRDNPANRSAPARVPQRQPFQSQISPKPRHASHFHFRIGGRTVWCASMVTNLEQSLYARQGVVEGGRPSNFPSINWKRSEVVVAHDTSRSIGSCKDPERRLRCMQVRPSAGWANHSRASRTTGAPQIRLLHCGRVEAVTTIRPIRLEIVTFWFRCCELPLHLKGFQESQKCPIRKVKLH
jgi:hypothetical protein